MITDWSKNWRLIDITHSDGDVFRITQAATVSYCKCDRPIGTYILSGCLPTDFTSSIAVVDEGSPFRKINYDEFEFISIRITGGYRKA